MAIPKRGNIQTDELIRRAASGDDRAASELLTFHRQRLRRMVTIQLAEQVLDGVDPSDVVLETMIEAARRLPEYSRSRPLPFYPWLRQLACDRIAHTRQRHVKKQKRSVQPEWPPNEYLPGTSEGALVEHLIKSKVNSSRVTTRKELRTQVLSALGQLAPAHREILVLRFLERLSMNEIAVVLGMSQEKVRSRQRWALEQFNRLVLPLIEDKKN